MDAIDTEDADQLVATPEVEPVGRFRIYLGAMPGVGKTCAMLDEGFRRFHRGADVVVGFVETHGRDYTASLVRDLPVLARRRGTYRGRPAEEFDLEAALARKPEVILVDELAHTNVPGLGAHAKRYEDVATLLEAGISVITTLNVQHIESVAALVEDLLGVPVRERVPDAVVRAADQIELIDSSPQALRRRLLHGHVYPPDRIEWALEHYFTTRNLTVLRELALRFVADSQVPTPTLAVASRARWQAILETKERYLAGVTLSAASPRVLRRAARMALRSHADLYALFVHPDEYDPTRDAPRLDALRTLAADLGAILIERDGSDIATLLVDEARARQVTQIVVGASRRRRIDEILHGSVLNRLLRLAGPVGIDVHVIGVRDYDPSPDEFNG
ncbi:osmosensitive K channel signal transduction histidine kinase, sensor subunit KdpD [Acidimicrobium ferrooxidans DSM 10331]|uniref:Osmosensitive K channel signal transduction histidine kinase, sensor subunit KdpD n=1 Tax=Acidimicrobium ferrooxidans (strain DSM 10331 / JCM 15462 / NBRC 103882 / ICP) TaxID=525909 RepID=C7LZE9_ACIFD|nr:universal stress protein [Acidimicrobium ferrooxidans]ACU54107.1 osmosensitive K channel signal transduction histidine kinase, sensor subunit KdpD [Acidimicrobium ferrooxidans DSM 10331]